MPYVYRHFIPQNIAPVGARRIVAVDGSGDRVCEIPLGSLAPPAGKPLYRFGVLSDIHLYPIASVAWNPETKFHRALTMFEEAGCSFCVVCGDLTNTGFYLRTSESAAGTEYLDERQFAKYKEICDAHPIPVYELCGNHESYYGMPVTNNLGLLETYTGKGVLAYTVEHGDDLFILCGQNNSSSVMSDADFQWLGETLAANTDKRCFVFVHSHIDDNVEGGIEDSGNPAYARENSIFGYWGAAKTANFIALMQKYPHAILFHGHTHMMFQAQQFDPAANYSRENGFHSVHVPSSGAPREVVSADGTWEARDSESQGYIVDVFAGCVVLNGVDLISGNGVPMGTFCISVNAQPQVP